MWQGTMGPAAFRSKRFDMRPRDRDDVEAVHPIHAEPFHGLYRLGDRAGVV
jgi:hypothetical protein